MYFYDSGARNWGHLKFSRVLLAASGRKIGNDFLCATRDDICSGVALSTNAVLFSVHLYVALPVGFLFVSPPPVVNVAALLVVYQKSPIGKHCTLVLFLGKFMAHSKVSV